MSSNKLLFLERYNDLRNRMKKKLFRRPNFVEVASELSEIGKNLMDFHHSAEFGHYIFKKKIECENINLRTMYTTQMVCARNMLQKEVDEIQFGIQMTGSNYVIATKTYYDIVDSLKGTDFKVFGVYLLCELANYSIQLNQYADAVSHMNASLNLIKTSKKDYFYYSICYKMAECLIVTNNYHKSHEILYELILNDPDWMNSTTKCPGNFICQMNISNILLILMKYPKSFDDIIDSDTHVLKMPLMAKIKNLLQGPLDLEQPIFTHIPIAILYILRCFIAQYHIGNTIILQEIEKQLSPHLSDINSLILYELLRRNADPELLHLLI